jgi:cytochrome c oxidase cbb3-type subunit IV
MSSGTVSGIVTGLLILVFLAIWAWAWSSRRRSSFDAASRLPLEEGTRPPEKEADDSRRPS